MFLHGRVAGQEIEIIGVLLSLVPVGWLIIFCIVGYQLLGSHGLAATDMPVLLSMVASGKLMPEKLVQRNSEIFWNGSHWSQ